MAVKTITIDMDAYERLKRLKRLKREGQSFSQVIKELVPPSGSTAGRGPLAALASVDVSDETLDANEREIEGRKTSPVRTPN